MAYPPLWGSLFWSLLEAIAMALAIHFPDQIPPEIADAFFRFILKLCRYLPCPACQFHCLSHTNASPPRFTRGVDVWKYILDFHNAVNRRTNKLEFSNDEAESHLRQVLAEFGWTPEKIEDAFLQDWWTALLMTTFTMSKTPDRPSDDEKKDYLDFLRDACTVVPFAFKKLRSGIMVRAVLVDFCNSPAMNLSTRDTTFESITNLHNSISAEFGRVPKTVKEFKDLFAEKFEQKNTTSLIRATQIHEEDQKKMLELQRELHELRTGQGLRSEDDARDSTAVSASYRTATIALACLLGALLLFLIAAYLAYRYRLLGKWRLVRVDKHKKPLPENDDASGPETITG